MADIKILLNDKTIAKLPLAAKGQYLARDTDLKGFFVVVGRRSKTFTIQGDLRQGGKRISTVRVAIGNTDTTSTRSARAVAKDYLAKIGRGAHPLTEEPEHNNLGGEIVPTETGITLREAWDRYRDVHMERKGRSERTIASYRDHVERIFADWLDTPLKMLAEHRVLVARRHDMATTENGPYIANGSMRTLRAIYNHARKANRELPPENPVTAIDWNSEARRDSAMGAQDLKAWFVQASLIDNPIRRDFHLFTLLSGCRPAALRQVELKNVDLRRRVLHIPVPKGGKKKAFDIPLSRQMVLCIIRLIRSGRLIYPETSAKWLFPADSGLGHLAEHRENRAVLSKWGNDLRQSFRTLATIAGVSEFDARLLMNHSIPGVNAGYITRHKLLQDHLREQQQAISKAIFSAGCSGKLPNSLDKWLRPKEFRKTLASSFSEARATPRDKEKEPLRIKERNEVPKPTSRLSPPTTS